MPQTLKISSATNTYTYAADGRKLKTVLGGSIVQSNHYYPFGMSFAEGSTTSQQPYKDNGKELDTERGLNLYDYSARYMDPALGRFSTVDPHAEKYYSWSPYAYCYNNPLKFIDPDGKDGVFIAFPDYKISTPLGKVGGLGHAGVLLIDNKTGYTKYYEYGRYDSENKGEVRTKSVSNVLIGKDGKLTEESLNKVLGQISDKAGQKGKIEGAYVKSDKFDKIKDYADSKMTKNKDPDRKEYTLTGNNCGTFAADVLKQDPDVKYKAPITIIARPKGMVKDWQSNFEKITYDPDKKGKQIRVIMADKSISLVEVFLLGLYLGSIVYIIGLLVFIFLIYKKKISIYKLFTLSSVQLFLSIALSIFMWKFWFLDTDIMLGFIFLPGLCAESTSILILYFTISKYH